MLMRIYQYDSQVTTSILHASCIAELEAELDVPEQRCHALLREYGGDFFTLDELDINNDPQLLC